MRQFNWENLESHYTKRHINRKVNRKFSFGIKAPMNLNLCNHYIDLQCYRKSVTNKKFKDDNKSEKHN